MPSIYSLATVVTRNESPYGIVQADEIIPYFWRRLGITRMAWGVNVLGGPYSEAIRIYHVIRPRLTFVRYTYC